MAQRARSTWSKQQQQQQQQQQKRKHQQHPFHESRKYPRTDPCDTPLDLHLLARSEDQSTLPVVHRTEASPSSSSSPISSNKRQRVYSDSLRSLPQEKALDGSLLVNPRPLSSSSSSSSQGRESRIDEATPLHGQCSEHSFHAKPAVPSPDFAPEKQQQKQSRQTAGVPLQRRRRQRSPPPPLGVAPKLQLDVNGGSNTAQLASHHLPLSPKEEKKRIRRERNRQSAASSRERRKKHITSLEQRRVLLEEENRRLERLCDEMQMRALERERKHRHSKAKAAEEYERKRQYCEELHRSLLDTHAAAECSHSGRLPKHRSARPSHADLTQYRISYWRGLGSCRRQSASSRSL